LLLARGQQHNSEKNKWFFHDEWSVNKTNENDSHFV